MVVRSVKLPDPLNASVDTGIAVEECRERCLADCSCVAYAAADIRGGGGAGHMTLSTSGTWTKGRTSTLASPSLNLN